MLKNYFCIIIFSSLEIISIIALVLTILKVYKNILTRCSLQQFFQDGPRIEAAFRRYFHRASPKQTQDSYTVLVCHANVIRYFVCRWESICHVGQSKSKIQQQELIKIITNSFI